MSLSLRVCSRRVHAFCVQRSAAVCVLCCREGEQGTWDLLGGIVTPDNRTAFTVSELKPFTAYSFRVLGVNELGQGAPSNSSYIIKTLRQRELDAIAERAALLFGHVLVKRRGR